MSDSAMEDTFENLLRNANAADIEAECAADPDYVERLDKSGHTPLMGACRVGRTDLVKILLNQGSDVHFRAANGRTPWDCALWYAVDAGLKKNIEASELIGLLERAGAGPDYGPLHEDTLRGISTQEVEALCAADSDFVRMPDDYDHTPLMAACAAGRTDLVRVLIRNGADVNHSASDGQTPLSCALDGSHFTDFDLYCIAALFNAGADPELRDPAGRTLKDALDSGNFERLQRLLARRADSR